MGAVFLFKWYNGSYIAGLLFQIKQGFDPKKKKNLPNRLYIADLEVTAKDVYIKRDFPNKPEISPYVRPIRPFMRPNLRTHQARWPRHCGRH